jgi:predicted metal-dependent hydrolase
VNVDAPRKSDIPVRIITSPRRKKTVSARFVGNTIEIRMPEGLSDAEQKRHISDLTSKLSRKRTASAVDLSGRAEMLAKKYSLPKPKSITWSARQQNRWGSCTPASGAVRISHRMGTFPAWVIDYVIVHELAHLVEPNHSPEFHALANRFPYCEKAEGFLVAVSLGHAGTLSDFSNPEHCLDE